MDDDNESSTDQYIVPAPEPEKVRAEVEEHLDE